MDSIWSYLHLLRRLIILRLVHDSISGLRSIVISPLLHLERSLHRPVDRLWSLRVSVMLPQLLLMLLMMSRLFLELTFQFTFLYVHSLLEHKIWEVLDLRIQNFLIGVFVLIGMLILMLHTFLTLLVLVIISFITGHLVVRHLKLGHRGLLFWRRRGALSLALLNLGAKRWQMIVFFRFFISLWSLLKLLRSLLKLIFILKGLHAIENIIVLLELSLAAEYSDLLIGLLKHLGHLCELRLQLFDIWKRL